MAFFHPGLLLFLNTISLVSGLQEAASPISKLPFFSVWNAPSAHCLSKYGVDLNLGTFSIIQNQNQIFMGEKITLFYENKLGLYPKYNSQGVAINGGVPQNASLAKHLRAASIDIQTDIPDRDFHGLAVVDWESWRPVWERNWSGMKVYKEGSEELVRAKHPDWSPAQIEAAARVEFEEAGRKIMEETLKLGQKERPNGLWGFYGFPNCYNHYDQSTKYTGECPPIELKRNDELFWLWDTSSALYPDIYLSLKLSGLGKDVLLYTQHRILEAKRVAAKATQSTPPIFPYSRFVYTYSLDFLSQEHLEYTIGESAALGTAGIVLWGDSTYSASKDSCETVKSFIDQTLGPYLVNVTSAAALCSQTLCSSKGRCERRNPTSSTYLHLDPAVWTVVTEKKPVGGPHYRVLGQMRTNDVTRMKSQFQCKCYSGWGGESCSKLNKGK
ncbi:hyaluronidase-1-like [Thunnus albacares]|uniref:hyaluronidase-1-like n=1 Tax=Thunnus albacares TaxID=8236 RepID=UPI001CF6D04F|nr:hyaluronidase-1-like [Thunnus albacares]